MPDKKQGFEEVQSYHFSSYINALKRVEELQRLENLIGGELVIFDQYQIIVASVKQWNKHSGIISFACSDKQKLGEFKISLLKTNYLLLLYDGGITVKSTIWSKTTNNCLEVSLEAIPYDIYSISKQFEYRFSHIPIKFL